MSTQPRMTPEDDDNGLVEDVLVRIFGRSYRTTLMGLVTLLCGVAIVVPGVPHVVVDICKVVLPIATGSGLLIAKDSRVSGTDRAAAPRPPSPAPANVPPIRHPDDEEDRHE